jgi:prepilin-type N-terminal cleavage/methylation domain-containing protein
MDTTCFDVPRTPAAGRPGRPVPDRRTAASAQRLLAARPGFTLVEMLTVIVIIGILASLITGAVQRARVHARNAAITIEINAGLEAALKQYKQKFGKYPPDFAGVSSDAAARAAVIRYLGIAFPRYSPPGASPEDKWNGLQQRLLKAYGLNLNAMDPAAALVFWLGGLPEGPSSLRLVGFSANPRDPFYFDDANNNGVHDANENLGSRLPALFEFDPSRLKFEDGVFRYYPDIGGAGQNAPYVYFRASSHGYDGHPVFSSTAHPEWGTTGPCWDTRVPLDSTGTKFDWVNRDSFQIRSAGLDGIFGIGKDFPRGDDYDDATYDDLTNFSGGTLESKM